MHISTKHGRLLEKSHDEGSQLHAVATQLGTLSDLGHQALQDSGGRTCRETGKRLVLNKENTQCHVFFFKKGRNLSAGLLVLADASTTPQEWFRRWPKMRSSLWSRRPSSRMFWTAGHKCSRTKPTMVGLRELLPRRI